MLNRLPAISALMVLTASLAVAGTGGSVYSRFGIGDVHFFPSERSAAMGGATIALLGTSSLSTINPATWTQLSRTRYYISALYSGFSSRDRSASSFQSGAIFNGVTLGVPLSTAHGVVISAGLAPYSIVQYDVVAPMSESGLEYVLKYNGQGGLSAAHIGISGTLGEDLHLGTKFNYMFGTLEHSTTQLFSSSQYTSAQLRQTTRLSGSGVSFGVVYSGVGEVLGMGAAEVFSIGGVFTTKVPLKVSRENFYEYFYQDGQKKTLIGLDTLDAGEGSLRLPLAAGAGISYLVKDKFVLAGDLYYQNWSQFAGVGPQAADYRDSYRLSVGGELLPKRELSADYIERIAYRLGAFYSSRNLRVANKGINEFGFTGGVGLPLFQDTRLNLGIEYSIRGTVSNNLQKDNILRISFTLNGGELWFVRPQDE